MDKGGAAKWKRKNECVAVYISEQGVLIPFVPVSSALPLEA